jgi:hypothetical protein
VCIIIVSGINTDKSHRDPARHGNCLPPDHYISTVDQPSGKNFFFAAVIHHPFSDAVRSNLESRQDVTIFIAVLVEKDPADLRMFSVRDAMTATR